MLMRAQSTSEAVLEFMWQQQKPLVLEASIYLIEMKGSKTLQGSNQFFSTILSYINRVIILKTPEFLSQTINVDLRQRGYSF